MYLSNFLTNLSCLTENIVLEDGQHLLATRLRVYFNMSWTGSRKFFLNSFLLPLWRAVRSYGPHLEERDPIWGDAWSHSPFIRRSPSWGFLGFSSAVRQMPGDLCTAPRTISLSPYLHLTYVTDVTLGASDLLTRNSDRSWWNRNTCLKLFSCRPWLHEQQVLTPIEVVFRNLFQRQP